MTQFTVPTDHLKRVYAEHGRAMQLYAARLLDDAVAAEDVVQEALIRLWRRPHVLDDDGGSDAVVASITVHRALGTLRALRGMPGHERSSRRASSPVSPARMRTT